MYSCMQGLLATIAAHYDEFPNFDGRTVREVYDALPERDARYTGEEDDLMDVLSEVPYRE